MKNRFNQDVACEVVSRIDNLSPKNEAKWDGMEFVKTPAPFLFTYKIVFEQPHARAKGVNNLILNSFLKPTVVPENPYKKISTSAPDCKMAGTPFLEPEKERLSNTVKKTQTLVEIAFAGKESNSLGKLTREQGNIPFNKSLQCPLNQFGV